MLYLQPTFPLIVFSWHEFSAVYIKRASPCAGAQLNIQAGLTLANAVAPLFVRGDNILSSPSVRWTLSWIPLTARISISVRLETTSTSAVVAWWELPQGRGKKAVEFHWNTGFHQPANNFQEINVKYSTYLSYYSVISLFQLTFAHTNITSLIRKQTWVQ